MSTGAEMMLQSIFKLFIKPKDAEAIAAQLNRMITDGTFDRIGCLPADLDTLKKGNAYIAEAVVSLIRQNKILAAELAALRELVGKRGGENPGGSIEPAASYSIQSRTNGSGLVEAPLAERGAIRD